MAIPDPSGTGTLDPTLSAVEASPGARTVPALARARLSARLLALLAVGHMVIDINQSALPAILPFLRQAFALSYAAAGTIMLAATVTSSVVQPLFGFLSDRTARRWLLPLSVLVSGLGLAFTGVAPSYGAILVLVVISGLGIAAYHPEGYKTATHVAGERKATALSFFSIGGNAGFALGPPIITALVTGLGLWGSLAMLLPSLAVAALLTVSLPRLSVPAPAQPRAARADGRRSMAAAMALLIGVVTIRSWTSVGLTTFVPFFYIDHLKADPRIVGPLLFVFLGAGAVGTLVGGPLADRWGARRFMTAAFFMATPLTVGFLLTRGILAFLLLAGAGFALISSFSVSVVLGQAYLPRRLGMASGLIVGFAIGTGGLGVTLLGWFADRWGLPLALGITAALPSLGFLASLFLPEPRRD